MTNQLIEHVWCNAKIVVGYDSDTIRQDACGAWIVKGEYGRNSTYGWVVDRVVPRVMGGDDSIENLRAMHWQNNIAKGSNYPVYNTALVANGNINIPFVKTVTVNKRLQQLLFKLYHK